MLAGGKQLIRYINIVGSKVFTVYNSSPDGFFNVFLQVVQEQFIEKLLSFITIYHKQQLENETGGYKLKLAGAEIASEAGTGAGAGADACEKSEQELDQDQEQEQGPYTLSVKFLCCL